MTNAATQPIDVALALEADRIRCIEIFRMFGDTDPVMVGLIGSGASVAEAARVVLGNMKTRTRSAWPPVSFVAAGLPNPNAAAGLPDPNEVIARRSEQRRALLPPTKEEP